MTSIPSPPATCATGRRILIIDDNLAVHDDFRKILCPKPPATQAFVEASAALFGDAPPCDSDPTFEVDSAFQGRDGLKRVMAALHEKRPYAMAFLDIRMPPGWDGVETAARIWEKDPDLQIVLCTAYSDYSWTEMRERLGKSDRLLILKKPFDNVEALQLAETLTEKWRLGLEARLRETILHGARALLTLVNDMLDTKPMDRGRLEACLERLLEDATS